MLQGGILFVSLVFVLVNLDRRPLLRPHQPADPSLVMSVAEAEARALAASRRRRASGGTRWHRLRRNRGALIGFGLIGLFVFVALFAPLIAPYDPREQRPLAARRDAAAPGRRWTTGSASIS